MIYTAAQKDNIRLFVKKVRKKHDEEIAKIYATKDVVSFEKNGLAPKLPDNPEKFLNGLGQWSYVVREVEYVTKNYYNGINSLVTTQNDGLAPRLPGDAEKFLNGLGQWAQITQEINYNTTVDVDMVSTENNGLAPRLPGDPEKFLNGMGEWVTVSGGGAILDFDTFNESDVDDMFKE